MPPSAAGTRNTAPRGKHEDTQEGCLAEWHALLAELRRTRKATRRLLEVLASVSGNSKKIIDEDEKRR